MAGRMVIRIFFLSSFCLHDNYTYGKELFYVHDEAESPKTSESHDGW